MVTKFIAVFDHLFGEGKTPDAAIEQLVERYQDYDGYAPSNNDITMYQVQRVGKAKIALEWES